MTLEQLQARLAANTVRARRARDLTPGAVAKAAGISPNTYRLIEYGRGNATLAVVVAIAAALKVQPMDLLAPVAAK